METQNEWVWYDDKIALLMSHEPNTGFCELQILEKNNACTVNSVSIWEMKGDTIIANMTELKPMIEHEIEEIRTGVFILDEGDTTYEPSSEDSISETDLEEEDYNLE